MNHDMVSEWYNKKKNIDEMDDWNKNKLKIWEEKVLGYFPEGSRVLDIGCGLGREAFALYEKGYAVTGIDISKPIIDKVKLLASVKGFDISFLSYNGRKLPFDDASFDVIIIWSQTFGLLYGDEYKRSFLKECRRVLKDGGILSFSGHDHKYIIQNHIQYTVGKKFFPYANTEMYWETFLPEELEMHAINAGYAILTCEQGEIYKPEDGVVLHCVCRK